MNVIKTLAKREPAATLAVLSAVAAAVCAALGKPEFAPILVAAGAAFLGLRTQVTPATKANETALQAAREAATQTAANLNSASAGKLGEVTDTATDVVNEAVGLVSGLLGGKK